MPPRSANSRASNPAAPVDGGGELRDHCPLQRPGDGRPDGRGGPVVLHQGPDHRVQLHVAVLGQRGQGALVTAALRPLVHLGQGGAGLGGGQQQPGHAHRALLLEPGQVAVTGRVAGQPVSHLERHQLVGAHAEQIPREGRRDVADALGIEHVHRARAGRAGELVQVGASAGGQHRARMADDPVREQARLVCARGRQDQAVQLEGGVQAAAVLGPAELRRELGGWPDEPDGQAQARAGPGPVGQRGQTAPPQPQFRQRREARAGTQPQPHPEPDRPDSPPALAVPGEHRLPEQDQDGEQDKDDQRGHRLMRGQRDRRPMTANRKRSKAPMTWAATIMMPSPRARRRGKPGPCPPSGDLRRQLGAPPCSPRP